jgi:cell fate regulator YaaT (PSP1 superfamily)
LAALIEVAFKGNRKEFFLWDEAVAPAVGSPIIVDADRGEDLGRVFAIGEKAELRCQKCAHGLGNSLPERKAMRLASAEEIARGKDLRTQDEEARRKAMEQVRVNGLTMKLSDAEWQWDRRKLTLYFTAEKRVDFRQLVRDLARTFRTRIELKQIGVRDEAALLGGVGRCGRELCCSTWLPELKPVSLQLAKEQNLSLNPAQISGCCGRLMCCLMYEHRTYVEARRRFPREGRTVKTSRGEERVVGVDIWKDTVSLRGHDGEKRVLSLDELKTEVGQPRGRRQDTHDEDTN